MLSSVELRPNQTTNVKLLAFGNEVFLYLNNDFDNMMVVKGVRGFGAVALFLSELNSNPALASIDSLRMTGISGSPFGRVNDLKGPLYKVAAYETTSVPENYSLSFNITPTGIKSDWSSIIHYSGDKSDAGPRGRMPGIFCLKSN